jgi:hypothetical protein
MNDTLIIPTHILVVNSHGSVKSGDIECSIMDIYGVNFSMVENLMKGIWDNDTSEVFSGTYEECEEKKSIFIENNVPVYIKEID